MPFVVDSEPIGEVPVNLKQLHLKAPIFAILRLASLRSLLVFKESIQSKKYNILQNEFFHLQNNRLRKTLLTKDHLARRLSAQIHLFYRKS